MQLFTKPQLEQLLNNGKPENQGNDHYPVVKLFYRGSDCVWLLTEIDSQNHDIAFGLCDLGLGFPELGYVSLSEISSVATRFGLENHPDFVARHPISIYFRAANRYRAVVEDETLLSQAVK